uniref:Uncharacterized protein n=1 Tax=Strigamia maritima TaxID=126957 RepID=T1IYK8_STRMM
MGDWRPFVYGGIASVTAEFGTFFIDTTKTRLQIQGQKIDHAHSELKYRGMFHAIKKITKEEGVRALYSGIWPAVLRQATYGTIKIGIYYTTKKQLIKKPEDETLLVNVACGMFAGMISSAIANPTDVLKVRMQSRNKNVSRNGMLRNFYEIYQQEGLAGLWRGVGPTAQRAAVIVGVELPIYDLTKKYFIESKIMGDTVPNHFVSSAISSLGGAIASNPLDVIKTRLMNQRRLKTSLVNEAKMPVIYKSSFDCLLQTVRNEGFLALYKGFIPTWVRLGPWNIIAINNIQDGRTLKRTQCKGLRDSEVVTTRRNGLSSSQDVNQDLAADMDPDMDQDLAADMDQDLAADMDQDLAADMDQDLAQDFRVEVRGPRVLKFHYKGVMLPKFFSKQVKSGE